MINNLLKKITSNKSKYPKGYIEIINCLDKENQTESNLNLVWKAYQLSKESHKNQFRKSGPKPTHRIDKRIGRDNPFKSVIPNHE